MGFTRSEVSDLYEALDMFKSIKATSAFDLLRQSEAERTPLFITTLSDGFDKILGG
jgi:hypothetical protein